MPVVHEELLALAVEAAHRAAEVVSGMRAEGVHVAGTKSSVIDIVTDADRESERLVRQAILDARPDDGILGEEGSSVVGSSGVRWIIDPIDGTVNYLYGIPAYAVSIAAEIDGEVAVGVVRDVVRGQDYTAIRGKGARCDGQVLSCRERVPQEQSLIATGFNYERHVRAHQAEAVARMLPQVRDIRRAGSCALDLCSVAAGRLDGYVEEGPEIWDDAAGGLIATEAGARVESLAGGAGKRLVVCAPRHTFERFLALVRACEF
jgi:myo-inositol-1(or 4)-monophosphatase